ncbi:phosphohydrolase [Paenibacillus sp. J31TS4]|uniref:HD domain-containing protein n=1 Tax=Paenibacillus sp. J31TS4 TaxID=2807195 RepID=UPI001B0D0849|nr:HD domain-containing protein [Paenibacillus sp. J31TS4]GIP38936.1 phosphohydrolase [Paenibacillus sp. J31TS4]
MDKNMRETNGMEMLEKQIAFIVEVDKLKHILRRTILMDKSRRENDAEHSWHLVLMAMVLGPYANEPELDTLRVIQMLIVHDLVEIDAGDTFVYDDAGHSDKAEREEKAAQRLFGMLPLEQGDWIYRLWKEFEDKETAEAKFAGALDRLHPLLHNYHTQGHSWREYGITGDRVLAVNRRIEDGSRPLWAYAERLIRDAMDQGYLAAEREEETAK